MYLVLADSEKLPKHHNIHLYQYLGCKHLGNAFISILEPMFVQSIYQQHIVAMFSDFELDPSFDPVFPSHFLEASVATLEHYLK